MAALLVALALFCGGVKAQARAAFYSDSLACEFALLTPLAYTPRDAHPEEIREAAGHLIRPGDALPELAMGRHLYMILRDGSIYLWPELDVARWAQDGHGIWTHEAFMLDFERRFGRSIVGEVIASGFLIYAFGEVALLSNRSGKFEGPPGLVSFAQRVFEAHGLKFTRKTDYERLGGDEEMASRAAAAAAGYEYIGRGHNRAARRFDVASLNLLFDVYTHPDGLKLIALYDKLARTLTPHLRYQTANAATPFFYKDAVARDLSHLSNFFTMPLYEAMNKDGIQRGIHNMWDGITRHQFSPADYVNRTGPVFVQNAINFLRDDLAPDELRRLEEVRDGFAALPDWKPPPTPPVSPFISNEPLLPLIEGPLVYPSVKF